MLVYLTTFSITKMILRYTVRWSVTSEYLLYKMWKQAAVTRFKALLWHLFEGIQKTSKSLSHLHGLRIDIWKEDLYNRKHNYCSLHHVVRQNVCLSVELENENSGPIWNVLMLLKWLHYRSSRSIMFTQFIFEIAYRFSKHLLPYRVWYLNFSACFKKNVNIILTVKDKIMK